MRTAARGTLALLLTLLLPFSARAADKDEVGNYISLIHRLYESLEYELALSRIPLARQLPRGTDEEVTLSLYEGILLCELRKQDPAAAAFRDALLLKPDVKLPVQQVAPKVEAFFESVRKQVKQELATSGCQPAVRTDCERLLKQLLYLQEKILRTNSASRAAQLEAHSRLGQQLRAARTSEELQQAAQALGSWQQRQGLIAPPERSPSRVESPKQEGGADKERTDAPRCQAAIRADCERLLKQIFYLQDKLLSTDSPTRLKQVKELSRIGQQLRAARTSEELQKAAQTLGSWQQRQLPQ